jgi:hypothetical protein
MKHILCIFIRILLFVLFVPGVLFTIPSKSSRIIVLLTHAVLFGFIDFLIHKSLFSKMRYEEGFQEGGPIVVTQGQQNANSRALASVSRATPTPSSQPQALPQCTRTEAERPGNQCNKACTQSGQRRCK